MSKPKDGSLLLPGPLGWEVWRYLPDGSLARREEVEEAASLHELAQLPGGDLILLFPVRGFHALPFRAESCDESLFEDLAVMHAERLGVRPDPMAGQLSDHFQVLQDEQSTVLLHAVLKRPGEGDLPLRTPQDFDLSARAYPVEGDTLCVWKELGRWVFGFYVGGKLLYAQATSSTSAVPDRLVLQEIQLALSQLALQGLPCRPAVVRLWPPEGELGEAGALAEGLGTRPLIEARPDPVMPDPFSRLLPEDVRAARLARKQRNRRVAMVALLVLLYLGGIAWFGAQVWQKSQEKAALEAELQELSGDTAEALARHNARWAELGPVVDTKQSPLEIMLAVQKAIPNNSSLRLETADLSLDEGELQLIGTAPQSAPATQFYSRLRGTPDLRWLEWTAEPPTKTPKGWSFRVRGEPKES
jgi:hypothetical protein